MISKKIASLVPSATEEVDNTVKEMQRNGIKDIISLGVGEPCFDTPPNIKNAAWDALKAGRTKYEPTGGDYKLREEICKKLRRDNGLNVTVDNIIVTTSGKFALFLAFQAVLEKRAKVMIMDPAWVSYEPAARIAGANVVRVASLESEGFQPDIDGIKREMDYSVKAIIVNSPCNPTGTVYEKTAIREIANIAEKYGALVISDEAYEHIIYDDVYYSPASEFDNVITVNSFSKGYAMTGWRLGYVVASKEIVRGMIKVQQHSVSCVPGFVQAGGIEALTSKESQQATKQMIEGYRERRALMLKLIRESELFDCSGEPQGTFYCFPSYRLNMKSVAFAKELLDKVHVATVPGSAFGACGEGHLRLSYATSKENIREAFDRIAAFPVSA
jgi:aspartate aminotransferase